MPNLDLSTIKQMAAEDVAIDGRVILLMVEEIERLEKVINDPWYEHRPCPVCQETERRVRACLNRLEASL